MSVYGTSKFIDPFGVVPTYTWTINYKPDGEDAFGKERTVQRTAATKGHSLIRQQQDDGALILKFSGTALTKEQHNAFIQWWKLCSDQTVIYQDFTGDQYEVVILGYMPKRVGVARNMRDTANAPMWVYDYDIDMDVVTVISGPWLGTES